MRITCEVHNTGWLYCIGGHKPRGNNYVSRTQQAGMGVLQPFRPQGEYGRGFLSFVLLELRTVRLHATARIASLTRSL